MYFPERVEKGCRTKRQRATARLKFILSSAAFDHTGKVGLRGLAKIVGMDYTTLYLYVREGSFSESAADKIAAKLPAVDRAMLISPLEIIQSENATEQP